MFNILPINLQLALNLHADILHIGNYPYATRELIEEAHKQGLSVIVGTTDDPEELRKLIKMGVDGITTNNPAILNEVKSSIY